jgi:hypothetical protein
VRYEVRGTYPGSKVALVFNFVPSTSYFVLRKTNAMRAFNESEKALLRKLAGLPPAETTFLSELLGKLYFSERKGRALIIQTAGRYAVFYLRPDVFDDEKSKRIEIIRMFEFMSLIRYLRDQRYIFIYPGEKLKARSMYFLHDSFNDPQPSGNAIVLNEDGDITAGPEVIRNNKNQVIYKGIPFNSDSYDMIAGNLTGALYVSLELRNLVRDNFKTKEEVKHKDQPWKTWAAISAILLLLAYGIFLNTRIEQYESNIEKLINTNHDMRQTPGAVSISPRSTVDSPQFDLWPLSQHDATIIICPWPEWLKQHRPAVGRGLSTVDY